MGPRLFPGTGRRLRILDRGSKCVAGISARNCNVADLLLNTNEGAVTSGVSFTTNVYLYGGANSCMRGNRGVTILCTRVRRGFATTRGLFLTSAMVKGRGPRRVPLVLSIIKRWGVCEGWVWGDEWFAYFFMLCRCGYMLVFILFLAGFNGLGLYFFQCLWK